MTGAMGTRVYPTDPNDSARGDRGKSEAEEAARSHAFRCPWVGMHQEETNWESPAATLGRHIDGARSCLRFAPVSGDILFSCSLVRSPSDETVCQSAQ